MRAFQNAHSCSVLICRFLSLDTWLKQNQNADHYRKKTLVIAGPQKTDMLSSYSFVKNRYNFELLFDENLAIYHIALKAYPCVYTFKSGAGNIEHLIAWIKTNPYIESEHWWLWTDITYQCLMLTCVLPVWHHKFYCAEYTVTM